MMLRLAAAVLLAIALCVPHAAQAQSSGALAGFFGMIYTPVGAFAPVVTGRPNAAAPSTGLQLRVSRWQFDGAADATTNIGAGLVMIRGRSRTTLELGYARIAQCSDCGTVMAGVDVQYDLARSSGDGPSLQASLHPALGFGKPRQGSGTVVTVGLSVPLSVSIDAGSQLRVVPFVSPGFGLSVLSGGGDSEAGSRATVAGGVSLGSQSSSTLLSFSARKIFLEGTPTIYGIGVVFAP